MCAYTDDQFVQLPRFFQKTTNVEFRGREAGQMLANELAVQIDPRAVLRLVNFQPHRRGNWSRDLETPPIPEALRNWPLLGVPTSANAGVAISIKPGTGMKRSNLSGT